MKTYHPLLIIQPYEIVYAKLKKLYFHSQSVFSIFYEEFFHNKKLSLKNYRLNGKSKLENSLGGNDERRNIRSEYSNG